MNDLDTIVASARELFAATHAPAELENAKARFLGKAGQITELMKGMAALSVEEKKTRGEDPPAKKKKESHHKNISVKNLISRAYM